MDGKEHKMNVRANNGKVIGSKLAKNGGEVRIKKISNGWIVTESWEEKQKADKSGYVGTNYKNEDTYFEKNPFA